MDRPQGKLTGGEQTIGERLMVEYVALSRYTHTPVTYWENMTLPRFLRWQRAVVAESKQHT